MQDGLGVANSCQRGDEQSLFHSPESRIIVPGSGHVSFGCIDQ